MRISIELAGQEIEGALKNLFPGYVFGTWTRDMVIIVTAPMRVDSTQPHQFAREIVLQFGARATDRYRAVESSEREARCANLHCLVAERMKEYAAENATRGEVVPRFVIECGEAIDH